MKGYRPIVVSGDPDDERYDPTVVLIPGIVLLDGEEQPLALTVDEERGVLVRWLGDDKETVYGDVELVVLACHDAMTEYQEKFG